MEVIAENSAMTWSVTTSHAKAHTQFCMRSGPGDLRGWVLLIVSMIADLMKNSRGGSKYSADGFGVGGGDTSGYPPYRTLLLLRT